MNVTSSELEARLRNIQMKLRIDTQSLSRYKMKLSSAEDQRKSSTYMGLAGVATIISVSLILVLMDVVTLVNGLKVFIYNK